MGGQASLEYPVGGGEVTGFCTGRRWCGGMSSRRPGPRCRGRGLHGSGGLPLIRHPRSATLLKNPHHRDEARRRVFPVPSGKVSGPWPPQGPTRIWRGPASAAVERAAQGVQVTSPWPGAPSPSSRLRMLPPQDGPERWSGPTGKSTVVPPHASWNGDIRPPQGWGGHRTSHPSSTTGMASGEDTHFSPPLQQPPTIDQARLTAEAYQRAREEWQKVRDWR